MNTRIAIVSLLALLFNASTAQISIRPYAGLNVAGFYFPKPAEYQDYTDDKKQNWKDVVDAYSYRPLMNLGCNIDIPLNDYISIETGLRFIQKGGNWKSEFFGDQDKYHEYNSNYRMDIVEVPVWLNYNMEFGDAYVTFSGGPTIGTVANLRYKLEYKETYKGETFTMVMDTKTDADYKKEMLEDIMPVDLGANLGIRLDYDHFNFGLVYGVSFSSVDRQWSVGFVPHYQNFQFNIGYKIELGN